MTTHRIIPTITLALALGTAGVAQAGPVASTAAKEFEGTVVSKSAANRTFRLRDSERGTKRFKVTSSTRFERVTFSSLSAGDTNIEVTAKRSNGRWVAIEVERSGGGGAHGDDDGGSDDD